MNGYGGADRRRFKAVLLPAGYEALWDPLASAVAMAADGKGRERHALRSDGSVPPFDSQPMMEIGRMVGVGGPLYQVMKKAEEAGRMTEAGRHVAARHELYGVIAYAAGAVLLIGEAERRAAERQLAEQEAALDRLDAATADDAGADFARSEGFFIRDGDGQ